MYCGKCGAEIYDDCVVCPNCQENLKKEPEKSNISKKSIIGISTVLVVVAAVFLFNGFFSTKAVIKRTCNNFMEATLNLDAKEAAKYVKYEDNLADEMFFNLEDYSSDPEYKETIDILKKIVRKCEFNIKEIIVEGDTATALCTFGTPEFGGYSFYSTVDDYKDILERIERGEYTVEEEELSIYLEKIEGKWKITDL